MLLDFTKLYHYLFCLQGTLVSTVGKHRKKEMNLTYRMPTVRQIIDYYFSFLLLQEFLIKLWILGFKGIKICCHMCYLIKADIKPWFISYPFPYIHIAVPHIGSK